MTTLRKLRVFLWHSPVDKPAIQDLYKQLSSESWIEPWLEDNHLLPGQIRETEIEKAIKAADVVIVGLSRSAVTQEGHIQAQLNAVLDMAKKKLEGAIYIIPLRLEECDSPERLKMLQAVNYFPRKQRWQTGIKLLASFRLRAGELGISPETIDTVPENSTHQQDEAQKKQAGKPRKYGIASAQAVVSTSEFPIRVIPFQENRNFSGRKAILETIHDKFSNTSNAIAFHALTGLGGIGKTQIAVQYSHQYGPEYDLVWWIRSETDASLASDYQALSEALQLPVKTVAEQMVFVNIVNNWLENTERKWLLVFDNVEAQEKMERRFPKKGNGHILITSQNPNWREIAQDSHVTPFTLEESREFLDRRLGVKDEAMADKLGTLLGGLPLAMEQACAYMSRRGTPVEIYLRLFEEQQKELWQHESPPKGYKSTVTTTWEMAFKQIRQTQPVAESLLNLFSFFAPDAIPMSMLKTFADELPPSVKAVVHDPIALEDCLAVLYSYSLVERDGDFISLHRLVQDVVRTTLPSKNLEEWLGLAVKIAENAFPFNEYDVATWTPCSRLLPHALTVAGYAEKYTLSLELAANIYQKVGEYLFVQAEYEKAGNAIQHAIDICQELFGAKNEKFARSLDYLGEIRQEQARYEEAFTLHQQALEILEVHPSASARLIARNFNNLGHFYYDHSDFENARIYFEKSISLKRSILGENDPDTATSLNNIGLLLRSQGDFEKAKTYHNEALTIRRVMLGGKHPAIAVSLNNMASSFFRQGSFRQGSFQEARKLLDEALAIQRDILGERHPNTATALDGLGALLWSQGDLENARKFYEEALVIRRTALGENHPDTALSLNNIGTLLSDQAKYVEARTYLEQALSIYETSLGEKHHTLIRILSNLAGVMFRLKQFPLARQYAARAGQICAEAKEKYEECEEIKQLQKSIPMGIGRKK